MKEDKVPETVVEKVKELSEALPQTEEVTEKSDVEILKEQNDVFEKEVLRTQEIRAKALIGGRADAGQPEESQEDKDEKEAADILGKFQ